MSAKNSLKTQREYSREKPFRWAPGDGPRADALERLLDSCTKPTVAMGETWFMGEERQFYTELLDANLEDSDEDVFWPFFEIVSGTCSFGPLDPAWKLWFRYFLPRIASQRNLHQEKFSFVPSVITGFVTQYPDDNIQTCPILSDVLDTLGRWVCAPFLWNHDDLRYVRSRHQNRSRSLQFLYGQVNGVISSSLFFCWKYLPPEEIETWVESLVAISGVRWRAQFLLWLVGAHPFLTGTRTQPSQLGNEQPKIKWEHSDLLRGNYDGGIDEEMAPFISNENRAAMQDALQKHITQKLFFDWLDCFASTRDVETALGDFWPLRFAELHLNDASTRTSKNS